MNPTDSNAFVGLTSDSQNHEVGFKKVRSSYEGPEQVEYFVWFIRSSGSKMKGMIEFTDGVSTSPWQPLPPMKRSRHFRGWASSQNTDNSCSVLESLETGFQRALHPPDSNSPTDLGHIHTLVTTSYPRAVTTWALCIVGSPRSQKAPPFQINCHPDLPVTQSAL